MLARWSLIVVLCVGVGDRWVMLTGQPSSVPPTAAIDRDVFAAKLIGIDNALADVPYCFSPDAAVVLTAGNDGLPGRAGVDDNLDGTVDDAREIGAVGSDDRCLAPADQDYQDALSAVDTVVISKGSFLPCKKSPTAERYLTNELGWFVVK